MIVTLHRPAYGNHCARGRHASRKRAEGVSVDAADCGGPVGILGYAVALTEEVGAKAIETDAIAVEEIGVVQPFDEQSMGIRNTNR